MARQDRELEAFEDELVEAWRNLARQPDAERGFLSAGSRSCWPQIVRERWDHPDSDARPRTNLTRREQWVVDALFQIEGCAIMVVPEDRRTLVGKVLNEKVWPVGPAFRWEAVWLALGGRASGLDIGRIRSRYETQLRRIAARFAQMEAARRG